MMGLLPSRQLKRFRRYTTVAHRIAKRIVVKAQSDPVYTKLKDEKVTDVMSILGELWLQLSFALPENKDLKHSLLSQG